MLRESVQESMKQFNLRAILGVEGVHRLESERAIKIGRFFSVAVVLALMVVLVQLALDLSHNPADDFYLSLGVWLVFAAELTVNLTLVSDKKRYLSHNWLNVMIVVIAFPWLDYGTEWAAIFRVLRLILLIRVVVDVFWDVVLVLRRNNFGLVLLGAAVLVVISGVIFATLEHKDFATGLWYSLVTITTVGYGDVVPFTEKGRIFGAFLIVFGVVFFSLITANISAFLIGSEQRKTEIEILSYVKNMKLHLEEQSDMHEKRMNHLLTELNSRMDMLQNEVEAKHSQQLEKKMSEFEARIANDTKHFQVKLEEIESRVKQK